MSWELGGMRPWAGQAWKSESPRGGRGGKNTADQRCQAQMGSCAAPNAVCHLAWVKGLPLLQGQGLCAELL